MPKPIKVNILAGREAVEAYRLAHTELHSKGWYKGISEDHTPLLDKLLADLKVAGFNSLDEFWKASDALTMETLGLSAGTDITAIEGVWK